MTLTLATRIIDLTKHEIAGLSAAMSRKLAAAVANYAAKSEASDATAEDLLNYFPMRYEDRSNFIRIDQLYDGIEASVEIFTRVSGGFQVGKNRGPRQPPLYIFEISGSDSDRKLKPVVVFWFVSGKQSQPIIQYYQQRFARGVRFVAFGKWEWDGRRNTFALKISKPDELEILPPTEGELFPPDQPINTSEISQINPEAPPDQDENDEDLNIPEMAMIHTSRHVPIYRKLGPISDEKA